VVPKGQTRLKQGLQANCSDRVCARGLCGGVCCGSLDPKMPITGISSAAAACISPESLLTTWVDFAIQAKASSNLVFPHKFSVLEWS